VELFQKHPCHPRFVLYGESLIGYTGSRERFENASAALARDDTVMYLMWAENDSNDSRITMWIPTIVMTANDSVESTLSLTDTDCHSSGIYTLNLAVIAVMFCVCQNAGVAPGCSARPRLAEALACREVRVDLGQRAPGDLAVDGAYFISDSLWKYTSTGRCENDFNCKG
jgi:hypothetical protein